MSTQKRYKTPQSTTLLDYFPNTLSAAKKVKLNTSDGADGGEVTKPESSEGTSNKENTESNKRERVPSPPTAKAEESLQPKTKKLKRVRLAIEDSDSEPEQSHKETEGNVSKVTAESKQASAEKTKKALEKYKYEKSSKEDKKQSTGTATATAATAASVTTSATPSEPTPSPSQNPSEDSTDSDWLHCKLEWLKPHKICDKQKRRPNEPEYDPTTLYVPPKFMNSQTPAHKQWWEMKSNHFDCVLFFKVGKFYELYHMDAAVGVNELGFSYMKGEFAHSGFPESAYARMASTLVAKGYKVARVEQTETPEMMQERCKNSPGPPAKNAKVVRREICQVTMLGTQVCGVLDPGPADAAANYMMAISEEDYQGVSSYGVCFVDTSIGLFHLGQFKDDKHSSRLLTTLAHYPPALIVYDRKSTTQRTSILIASHCPSARREPLAMWTPDKTLKALSTKYYQTNEEGKWPDGIKPFLDSGDPLGLTPAKNCHLAIKALSGCVAFLTECLLDLQVLGMAQFTTYTPPNALALSKEHQDDKWKGGSTMVLDAITLRNLRIVQDEGCLYERLNFCTTAMGKRLLYQWVCAPSCNLSVIRDRQAAVKYLFEDQELCQDAKNILTNLPDLERLLAKVHALGNYLRSKHHPDSRAIFYEEKIYSKRKVLDFISILNGFTAALKLVELFGACDASLLKKLTQFEPVGGFPDYKSTLIFFKDGFNQEEAEKEGRIMPGEGVDDEYDSILQTIDDIKGELQEYLNEQQRYFKCRLAYVGTDKKRYQIEVPVAAASKAGDEYHMVGARKGFKRFSTDETRGFLARMIEAEEKKRIIMLDLSRRMFEKFSGHYKQWETVVQCVATLDILLAMAEYARQQSGDVCLPTITCGGKQPYINIVDGRHPCIVMNDYIPNDTQLGGEDKASLLLITGPNMGGKSTLMRQVGLLTVLAHLGSYVPAAECSMQLADRVFTRLGASDDILSGQSTFLVEMNETAAILEHATRNSLVLLDELGRGTSTYDGTAIATSVCVALAERGCRVVFSTHFHSLVKHLDGHPNVQLGHMACMVETDEAVPDKSEEIPEETITFLYKLTPGSCPKSYGFNAARLAGIPKIITSKAHQVSKKLEEEAMDARALREIARGEIDAHYTRQMLTNLPLGL